MEIPDVRAVNVSLLQSMVTFLCSHETRIFGSVQGPGKLGYSPKFYTQTEQQQLEQDIAANFIGAELCGCIKITKFLMAGGYGRGVRSLGPTLSPAS